MHSKYLHWTWTEDNQNNQPKKWKRQYPKNEEDFTQKGEDGLYHLTKKEEDDITQKKLRQYHPQNKTSTFYNKPNQLPELPSARWHI